MKTDRKQLVSSYCKWKVPHTARWIIKVTWDFLTLEMSVCMTSCLKYPKTPERSSSELQWHSPPQNGSLPCIRMAPDSKQWIKHSAASLWRSDPRRKHEYAHHISSIRPNLRWLVMWPPYPACSPICDDTWAPPFHRNKLTNTRRGVCMENLHWGCNTGRHD